VTSRVSVLAGVWVAAVLLSGGALWLIVESNHIDNKATFAWLGLTASFSFVTSGLIAIWRRPENRTGLLMVATGYAWLLGALTAVDESWIFTIGFLLSPIAWGPFAQLILAYPTGRLQQRSHAWLVGAVYALVLVGGAALLLVGGTDVTCGRDCPESAIAVWHSDDAASVIAVAISVLVIAIVAISLTILVRRWRAATPALRRALGGVFLTSGTALALLIVAEAVHTFSDSWSEPFEYAALAALGAVPIAFLLGVLRARLARSAAGDLLLDLGRGSPLRDALARAMHDPSLEIGYWLPESKQYVDSDGATMGPIGEDRVLKHVERDGRPIAVLVHDPTLEDEPELVDAAAAAAGLWLENERLQAELRSQYSFLLTVVHTTPSLLIAVDTEGRIRNFNAAVEIASGLDDPEQIQDRLFWDVFADPDDREEMEERFRAAAPDFAPTEYENSFTNARGDELVITWSSAPLRDEDGNVSRVIAGGVDITERKRQELVLRESGERLHAIIESSPAAIVEVDLELRVSSWNAAAERIFGWTAEEIIGQPEPVIPPELQLESEALDARMNAGEVVTGYETVRQRKDGSTIDVAISAAPVRDSTGAIVSHIGIYTDITTRKRQERELRESEERLRAAIESSPVAIVEVGGDDRILAWNRAAELIFGWSAEEVIGQPVPFIPPDRREEVEELVERVLAGQTYTGVETVRTRKDGAEIDVEISSAPIRDASGEVVSRMAVFADITERRQREDALRASEERLRAAIEASPVAIVEMGFDDRVVSWNAAAERTFGWSAQDIVGELLPIVPPELADVGQQLTDRVEAGEAITAYETVRRRKDGTLLDVEISAAPLRDSTGAVIGGMAVYVDVSERKQREIALRTSEERIRAAIEASPVAIVELGVDSSVLMWNPAAERMFGWTADEVVGGRLPVVPDHLRDEHERLVDKVRRGIVQAGHETARKRKDGELVDVEISSAPIRDSTGEVVSYMTVYVDVTERKRREKEVERERDFLDTLADAVPSFLVVVDSEGRLVDDAVNRAYTETFGWTSEELEGRSFLELVATEDGYGTSMALAAAANGVARTDLECRWLARSGEERVVGWTATPLLEARSIPLVLVTGADLTERVLQEREIRASRQRIVETADAERRRLERNLHDGAQQRLVALSVSLRLSEAKLSGDPDGARELLTASREELSHAIDELRELARGIHPAVLTDRGLGAAIDALVARSPLPVEADVPEERLPASVEAAVYYVVSEALANVVKYAGATAAAVRVEHDSEEGIVTVEVADDGCGGADPNRGSGLRGLVDRVAALDGTLIVDSPEGSGTCVRAEIPVREPALSGGSR
jgi:PAS domain S-box-containing protein